MNQNAPNTNGFLLKVEDLKTYFPIKKGLMRKTIGFVKAVDGVSFAVKPALTFGLVGESGCGKTTVARSILRLIPVTSGKVTFDNTDVLSADKSQMQNLRSDICLVFQDPFGSLNPRMTVGSIVGEPLKIHKNVTGAGLTEQVCRILSKVGLSPEAINRYPHEFSGGQRQRIGIARALILQPKFVICDEPVSALDVSIQSQILNLLKDLQDEFALTYLFIAHDLAVVQFSCDIVAVMYMGKIVEQAPVNELYGNPLHPYTITLMSAIPRLKAPGRKITQRTGGEPPPVTGQPAGCPFHPRCLLADGRCLVENPTLSPVLGRPEHLLACLHSK
ncbi:MAG: oligopeptide/dipeptide ABC transporter ATP-binding protein [Sedimentisphaerales bacterium]